LCAIKPVNLYYFHASLMWRDSMGIVTIFPYHTRLFPEDCRIWLMLLWMYIFSGICQSMMVLILY